MLTGLAAGFEFGLPAILVVIAIKRVSARPFIAPILGALTPFCLGMAYAMFEYYTLEPGESGMHMAGFVMGFMPYLLCLSIGIVGAFLIPRGVNMVLKYLAGVVFASGFTLLLMSG